MSFLPVGKEGNGANLRGFESESEIKKPTSYNKEFSGGRYLTA